MRSNAGMANRQGDASHLTLWLGFAWLRNFYSLDTSAGLSSRLESFRFHKIWGNPQLSERMLAALLRRALLHGPRGAAVVSPAPRRGGRNSFTSDHISVLCKLPLQLLWSVCIHISSRIQRMPQFLKDTVSYATGIIR